MQTLTQNRIAANNRAFTPAITTGAMEYATTIGATFLSGFHSQVFINLQKDGIQTWIISKRATHWTILLYEKP